MWKLRDKGDCPRPTRGCVKYKWLGITQYWLTITLTLGKYCCTVYRSCIYFHNRFVYQTYRVHILRVCSDITQHVCNKETQYRFTFQTYAKINNTRNKTTSYYRFCFRLLSSWTWAGWLPHRTFTISGMGISAGKIPFLSPNQRVKRLQETVDITI